MYGNYFSEPFMAGYINPMITNSTVPFNATRGIARGLGTSFRVNNNARSIFSSIKNINWSGFLNNTSKTLGVVKDAIPVVKEVRPMISNMKSMLKIASAFNDATIDDSIRNSNIITDKKENTDIINNTSNININENEPNFFL